MISLIEQFKYGEVSIDDNLVSIHRPSNPGAFGGFASVYRSEETRAIDREFGLDGSYVLKGEFMSEVLLSAVSYNMVGNQQIASTLKVFIGLAIDSWGVIVGVEENQLALLEKKNVDLNERLFIKEAIDQGYLVRKNINGENVLFPANILLVRN